MAYVKIRALAVADDCRRQGTASALLARALTVHRERSAFFAYRQFTAGDAALARFYQRQGFTIHARASRSFSPAAPSTPASVPHRSPGEQMSSRML
ncbi:GNAT family N-acetyltransferase [Streptomyces sp. NPDC056323]|uniref:GNAT family N-acetyltransferase n=1 Tax=unclassified Streptomyces TaxID=2593676 RepID=UPI0035DE32C1